MFCILMDAKTNSFYMRPREACFLAYSDPEKYEDDFGSSAKLIETKCKTFKELTTQLYNAGFSYGYFDGKEITLSKSDSEYYQRNANDISFAQFLITQDKLYLDWIKEKKNLLYTLCKIDGTHVYFPIMRTDEGEELVYAYTTRERIPKEMKERFEGWKEVHMTFESPCIVNNSFIIY